MPRHIEFNQQPDPAYTGHEKPAAALKNIVLSIVEFDPSQGEEIFLGYSKGCEHGPIITRSGDRAPSMRRVWDIDNPWDYTTNPEEQRMLSWFIDEPSAEEEIQACPDGKNAEMAREGLIHDREFKVTHPDWNIIGQQGCGDLTMNQWCVAYLCSYLTQEVPKLLWPYEEPWDRTYTCLVKWKHPYRVTIEDSVKFSPLPGDQGKVQINGQWVTDDIEFAVFGKQVIHEGQPVELGSVVHQFSDIRHLLQLPTINPPGELYAGDPAPTDPKTGRRVRYYYGKEWQDDVWLGEKQLLDDWNLQRAALHGPVVLNRLYGGMGVSISQLEGAMTMTGYRPAKDPQRLAVGEWQHVPWNNNLVDVYLKPNRYPWNLIGVNKEATRIYCLACNGHQGRSGYTLQEAVNEFLKATRTLGIELWSALLMDEGNDVFQKALLDGTLKSTVPLRRRQLRAKFIFAKKCS